MMMMRLPTIIDENDRRWLRTVITASKKKEEKEKKERNQHTRSNTYVNGRRRSRRWQRAVKRKSRCNGKWRRCLATVKDTRASVASIATTHEKHFFEKQLPQCQRTSNGITHTRIRIDADNNRRRIKWTS